MTTTTTKRIGDRAAEQIANQIDELIGDLGNWTPMALATLEDRLEEIRTKIEDEIIGRNE